MLDERPIQAVVLAQYSGAGVSIARTFQVVCSLVI